MQPLFLQTPLSAATLPQTPPGPWTIVPILLQEILRFIAVKPPHSQLTPVWKSVLNLPGTQLQIGHNNGYHGALVAQGTDTNPITFTSNAADPSPGDWNGIHFSNFTHDDSTILEHCIVEYGGANTHGNLYFNSASGTIRNCTITNSSTNGIHLAGSSSPVIDSCILSNNAKNGIYSGNSGDMIPIFNQVNLILFKNKKIQHV